MTELKHLAETITAKNNKNIWNKKFFLLGGKLLFAGLFLGLGADLSYNQYLLKQEQKQLNKVLATLQANLTINHKAPKQLAKPYVVTKPDVIQATEPLAIANKELEQLAKPYVVAKPDVIQAAEPLAIANKELEQLAKPYVVTKPDVIQVAEPLAIANKEPEQLAKPYVVTKPDIISLPDNLIIILQDLGDQLKLQKQITNNLESIMVSELNPKINFLLETVTNPVVNNKITTEITLIVITSILKLANMYLLELHDIPVANNMLTVVEQLVGNLPGSIANEFRIALAQDKQKLLKAQLANKGESKQYLTELLAAVANYPYKGNGSNTVTSFSAKSIVELEPVNSKQSDNSTAQLTTWQTLLHNLKQEVKTLVKIKRSDLPVTAVAEVAKFAEYWEREKLKLILEQLKIISFEQNSQHAQELLGMAHELLASKFIATDLLVQQGLAKITALQQLITQPQPVIELETVTVAAKCSQLIAGTTP